MITEMTRPQPRILKITALALLAVLWRGEIGANEEAAANANDPPPAPKGLSDEQISEIYNDWRIQQTRAEHSEDHVTIDDVKRRAARYHDLSVAELDALIQYHEATRKQRIENEKHKDRLFITLAVVNIPIYALFAWALGIFTGGWCSDAYASKWDVEKKFSFGYQWAWAKLLYLVLASGTVLFVQYQVLSAWLY